MRLVFSVDDLFFLQLIKKNEMVDGSHWFVNNPCQPWKVKEQIPVLNRITKSFIASLTFRKGVLVDINRNSHVKKTGLKVLLFMNTKGSQFVKRKCNDVKIRRRRCGADSEPSSCFSFSSVFLYLMFVYWLTRDRFAFV